MNENIKFTADGIGYATDDTGVLVAFSREYTDRLVAIIRNEDGKYITAPLSDIEYVAEESNES